MSMLCPLPAASRRSCRLLATFQIKPLSETKVVTRGADFMGESFIFSVGATLVIVEVARSSRKKDVVEKAKKEHRSELKRKETEERFRTLEDGVEKVTAQMDAVLEALQRHPTAWTDVQAAAALATATASSSASDEAELTDAVSASSLVLPDGGVVGRMLDGLTATFACIGDMASGVGSAVGGLFSSGDDGVDGEEAAPDAVAGVVEDGGRSPSQALVRPVEPRGVSVVLRAMLSQSARAAGMRSLLTTGERRHSSVWCATTACSRQRQHRSWGCKH